MKEKKISKKKVILIVVIISAIILLFIAKNTDTTIQQKTQKDQSTTKQYLETTQNYPKSLEYDEVLAHGDGYFLVKKEEETYNSATTKYGVINQSGEWLCPLSDENGFAKSAEEIMHDAYNRSYYPARFDYLNEGFFLVKTYCVLVENESIPSGYEGTYTAHSDSRIVRYDGEIIGKGGYMMTEFYDGYCFVTNTWGNVVRIDTKGNRTDIAKRREHTQWGMEALDAPSCGLIYCDNAFYDIKTCEKIIDLSEYNFTSETILDKHQFSADGTFTFYFYNPNRTEYVATIDVNGNFIKKPEKVLG
ncbi:MAG: hypothetical protein ACI4GC_07240 [Acutalibacteraceae bacterium]